MLSDYQIASAAQLLYGTAPPNWWTMQWPDPCVAGLKLSGSSALVVFRGSKAPIDWYNDILQTLPMKDPVLGWVHSGFWGPLVPLMPKIDQAVAGCSEVIVAGHSLGAARAVLYAACRRSLRLRVDRLVVFGCPRPGYQPIADAVRSLNSICYHNRHDPVACVPFNTFDFPYVPALSETQVDEPPPWDDIGLLADHHMELYLLAAKARS